MRKLLLTISLALLLLPSSALATGWKSAPTVPSFTTSQRDALRAELKRNIANAPTANILQNRSGSRTQVFMQVGDSHTVSDQALSALACQTPVMTGLSDRAELSKTLSYFSPSSTLPVSPLPCQRTSWGRVSTSALSGAASGWSIAPGAANSKSCSLKETPLECENRILNPAFALVLFGTNDAAWGFTADQYKQFMLQIVRFLRSRRVIPVLSSIMPTRAGTLNPAGESFNSYVESYNQALYEISQSERVPFVNLWRSLTSATLASGGFIYDGVHLNVLGNQSYLDPCGTKGIVCQGANLTSLGQSYGNNRRNLLLLRTMDKIRREIIIPVTG